MGDLFQSSQSTKSTTKTQVPRNYQSGLDTVLSMGADAANNPFQSYTDQRVANFDPAEQQALDALSNNFNQYDPLLQAASQSQLDMINHGGLPTGSDIQGLMDPYIQQVLGLSQDRLKNQYELNLQDIGSRSALSGAFGGTRQGVQEGAAGAEFLKSGSELYYGGMSDAWNNAVSNWFKGQDNSRANNTTGSNLALGGSNYNINNARALASLGGTRRDLNQANLDFAYQQFEQEQQYPWQQANNYGNILYQYPKDLFTKTQNSTTTTNPSIGSVLLGGAMMAAGAMTGNPGAAMSGAQSVSGALNPSPSSGGASAGNPGAVSPFNSQYIPSANPLFGGAQGYGANGGYAKGGRVKAIKKYAMGGNIMGGPGGPMQAFFSKMQEGGANLPPMMNNPMMQRFMPQGGDMQHPNMPGMGFNPSMFNRPQMGIPQQFPMGNAMGRNLPMFGGMDPSQGMPNGLRGNPVPNVQGFAEGGRVPMDDGASGFNINEIKDPEQRAYYRALLGWESGTRDFNSVDWSARPYDPKQQKYLSSAFGGGQFTLDTWNKLAKQQGVPAMTQQMLDEGNLPTARQQAKMLRALTESNRSALGNDADSSSLFMAHQLGAGAYGKIAKAKPDESMSSVLGSTVARNVSAGNETVGQYMARVSDWVDQAREYEQRGGPKDTRTPTGQMEDISAYIDQMHDPVPRGAPVRVPGVPNEGSWTGQIIDSLSDFMFPDAAQGAEQRQQDFLRHSGRKMNESKARTRKIQEKYNIDPLSVREAFGPVNQGGYNRGKIKPPVSYLDSLIMNRAQPKPVSKPNLAALFNEDVTQAPQEQRVVPGQLKNNLSMIMPLLARNAGVTPRPKPKQEKKPKKQQMAVNADGLDAEDLIAEEATRAWRKSHGYSKGGQVKHFDYGGLTRAVMNNAENYRNLPNTFDENQGSNVQRLGATAGNIGLAIPGMAGDALYGTTAGMLGMGEDFAGWLGSNPDDNPANGLDEGIAAGGTSPSTGLPWGYPTKGIGRPKATNLPTFDNSMAGASGISGKGDPTLAGLPQSVVDGLSGADTDQDALMQQLIGQRLEEMKSRQQEHKDPLFGLFENANVPLMRAGLALLANSDRNFGEALGMAGLQAMGMEEKDRMDEVKARNDQLKDIFNMRYMQAQMRSMDPKIKERLQEQAFQRQVRLLGMKQDNAKELATMMQQGKVDIANLPYQMMQQQNDETDLGE